jgi:hypothetical protein
MGFESESDVYAQCRQIRVKQDRSVCIWGGSSPGLTDFFKMRERGNNCHSWSPPPPPHSSCPCQAKQTSSCRENHPTCQDSKSNNSDGHSHLDTVPGVRLNHLYLEDWHSIAKGCANQGGEEQSWSRVRVDSNGPDLLVVAL